MIAKKILAALCLLATVSQAAKMLQNPLRIRVNSELIKGVFHKSDADLLRLLENIELGDYSLGHSQIKGLSVTLAPEQKEEFHYRLSLDQAKYLGLESDELLLKGTGKIVHEGSEEGEDFLISGPVSGFKVAFQVNENSEKGKIQF